MRLLLIAKSNIRKSKGALITLTLLIAISALLLYIGINLSQSINTFVDDKNTEINGAHFIGVVSKEYKNEAEETIKSIDGYSYMEINEALVYNSPKIKNLSKGGNEKVTQTIIENIDEERKISTIKILDPGKERNENSIVLPYVMKVADGYETGDEISIKIGENEKKFIIYGFYEDVMFGNPMNILIYKFFVFNDGFDNLVDSDMNSSEITIFNVILDDIEMGENFENEYSKVLKEKLGDTIVVNQAMNYDSFKIGNTMFILIISIILMSFALIIVIISLIIINSTIVTQLERNIVNIGSMEALGYTSKDIRKSIILQFILISIIGVLLGVFGGISVTPVVTNIVSSSIGILWNGGINLVSIIITALIILTFVTIITLFASRKIKEITPLTALRGGLKTHSFTHNFIPLENTRLSLNISLGVKKLLQNGRQNIGVSIIIASLTFITIFGSITLYNMVYEKNVLLNMMGMETGEIIIYSEDSVVNEVSKMDQVKKIVNIDEDDMTLKVNNLERTISIRICDDYNRLNINTLIDGRMPRYDNEISLSIAAMDSLNLDIGDSVTILYSGNTFEYLIVGKTQQMYMGGRGGSITLEGMKNLISDYTIKSHRVNLNQGIDIEEFRKEVISKFNLKEGEVINQKGIISESISSLEETIRLVCYLMFGISIFIVVLILFEIVRVKILKERKILGIYKSLGFVTKDLMIQIIVSFLPVVIIGAIVGGILGAIGSDFLMELLMASSGLYNINFIVKLPVVLIPATLIVLVALATITVVAYRTKKVSPYDFIL